MSYTDRSSEHDKSYMHTVYSYTVVTSPTSAFGSKDANGSWNGVIGALQRNVLREIKFI